MKFILKIYFYFAFLPFWSQWVCELRENVYFVFAIMCAICKTKCRWMEHKNPIYLVENFFSPSANMMREKVGWHTFILLPWNARTFVQGKFPEVLIILQTYVKTCVCVFFKYYMHSTSSFGGWFWANVMIVIERNEESFTRTPFDDCALWNFKPFMFHKFIYLFFS